MADYTKDHESNHGLSLVLLSNSDLKSFPNNSPSDFENIFKRPIKLDQQKNYEVVLANLHTPSYQNTLVRNDREGSYIQYNIGVFNFNHSNGIYEVEKNSVTPLWKWVPNRSFAGLAFENEMIVGNGNLEETTDFSFRGRTMRKDEHMKFIKKK